MSNTKTQNTLRRVITFAFVVVMVIVSGYNAFFKHYTETYRTILNYIGFAVFVIALALLVYVTAKQRQQIQ